MLAFLVIHKRSGINVFDQYDPGSHQYHKRQNFSASRRSVSSNGTMRSMASLESKMRISPERWQAPHVA
jgi:hypothetical protein